MGKIQKILTVSQVAFLFLIADTLHAQRKETTMQRVATVRNDSAWINGNIINTVTGEPINGANIAYKEYSAAISDSLGNFKFAVPNNNVTILIKAPGFSDREMPLKGMSSIAIQLQPVGVFSFYNEVQLPSSVKKRSQTTGAIESISPNGAWANNIETPDAYLQGKVAGLNAVRRSGTPNAGANLFLRGYSSLYASNQPIIVVDGVYYDNGTYGAALTTGYYNNPLSFIDLKDIDNITFLKDASYAYGAKGANGAIIITTAKAKEEATAIDASLYGSVTLAPQKIPVMDASAYRSYLSEQLQSKGLSAAAIAALPYMNDNPGQPDYYRTHNDNDWQDQMFRNAYTKNAYLKITGGDNIAKYGLSIGYANSPSSLQNTGLTRYNMRFNADLNLSKRLTASANVSYFRNEQNIRNTGIAPTTNPLFVSLVKAPFFASQDISDAGIVSPQLADRDTLGISNPIALIGTAKGQNNSYRYVGAISFNYLLGKYFSLATTLAVTNQKIRENFFIPERGVANDTLMNGVLAKNRSGAQVVKVFNVFNDTRLNYKRTFGSLHDLAATIGVRYNKSNTEQDFGLGFNSATDQLTSVGYGLNTLRQIGGSLGASTWLNTYLTADYSFENKYFVTFNGALDGSSRFGRKITGTGLRLSDRTLAFFPAIGFSWLPSSENFLAGNKTINLAKIRLSYGLSGNDDIGNYTARSYYTSQNLLGISGLVRGNISDERLQWEQVAKLNAGIDLGLFNERVNITLDAYRNTTSKMIIYEPGPTISGQDYIITNSGGMRTTGIEANVNTVIINKRKLKWQLGFNVAKYKSEITKLPAGNIYTDFADGTMVTGVGNAPNLFYGYKTFGVYASDAAAESAGLKNQNSDGTTTMFKGGDVIFDDLNKDGVIDSKDRQVIGNPNPKLFGGISTQLTYSHWTLDVLATFSLGNDIYNYARRQLESESNYYNQTAAIQNRWRADGQMTNIPKATWGDPMGNSRFSDRWIEKGSYLRLRTISLTYNVPIKPTALKYVNVYLTGTNLLTLTKYMGYDPEFSATSGVFGQGVDTYLEPQYKNVQLGVRVGL